MKLKWHGGLRLREQRHGNIFWNILPRNIFSENGGGATEAPQVFHPCLLVTFRWRFFSWYIEDASIQKDVHHIQVLIKWRSSSYSFLHSWEYHGRPTIWSNIKVSIFLLYGVRFWTAKSSKKSAFFRTKKSVFAKKKCFRKCFF